MKTEEILTYISEIPISRNFVKNLPYEYRLRNRARALRKAGNLSEVIFWRQVHRGKFWKIDFDRQRIIGNYIVDFYIKSLGLIIEIDGNSHDHKEDYDSIRETFLISLGLKILKISDFIVLNDLENVMKELEEFIIQEYSLK